jgi:hypothetical protein
VHGGGLGEELMSDINTYALCKMISKMQGEGKWRKEMVEVIKGKGGR